MPEYHRVKIYGTWYLIDRNSMKVDVNKAGTRGYATFDAIDELLEEPVKLQYMSDSRSLPEVSKPYRIIRPEKEV